MPAEKSSISLIIGISVTVIISIGVLSTYFFIKEEESSKPISDIKFKKALEQPKKEQVEIPTAQPPEAITPPKKPQPQPADLNLSSHITPEELKALNKFNKNQDQATNKIVLTRQSIALRVLKEDLISVNIDFQNRPALRSQFIPPLQNMQYHKLPAILNSFGKKTDSSAYILFWSALVRQMLQTDKQAIKALVLALETAQKNNINGERMLDYLVNHVLVLPTNEILLEDINQIISQHNTIKGKHHPDLALLLDLRASIFYQNNKLSLARDNAERASDIWQRSRFPKKPVLMSHYILRSDIYLVLDDETNADLIYDKLIQLLDADSKEDDLTKKVIMNKYSTYYLQKKQYAKALPMFKNLLKQLDNTVDIEDPQRIPYLKQIADIHQLLHQTNQAISYYDELLTIQEIEFSEDDLRFKKTAVILAQLYLSTKDKNTTITLLDKAEKNWTTQGTPDDTYLAKIYYMRARIHFDDAEYHFVKTFLDKTLSIQEKFLTKQDSALADTYALVSKYHFVMDDYTIAHKNITQAIKIAKVNNPYSVQVISFYTLLADIYFIMGQVSTAESFYLKSNDSLKKSKIKDKNLYILNQIGLANILIYQAGYSKAIQLLSDKNLSTEKRNQITPPTLIKLKFTLAKALIEIADYRSAQKLLDESKTLASHYYKKPHPDLASIDALSALLATRQGKYKKSQTLSQEALNSRMSFFGKKHTLIAKSLNEIADRLSFNGKYSQAIPLYEEAKKIYANKLGAAHNKVAEVLIGLASAYLKTGQYDKAHIENTNAANIFKISTNMNHPIIAINLNNQAIYFRHINNFDSAFKAYIKAQDILASSLGDTHPQYATLLNNIAILLADENNFPDAKKYFELSLEILQKAVGDKHPLYAVTSHNYGNMLYKEKQYADAERLFIISLDIRDEILDENHPDLADNLTHLANSYQIRGKFDVAEKHLKRALKINQKIYGAIHPNIAIATANLAKMFQLQKLYEKSDQFYQRAINLMEFNFDADHPVLLRILDDYKLLLNEMTIQ